MSANFELHHDDDSNDMVSDIMAFEEGSMDEERSIALFQRLLDSGLVWQLQGSYGRTAQRLLDRGLIKKR